MKHVTGRLKRSFRFLTIGLACTRVAKKSWQQQPGARLRCADLGQEVTAFEREFASMLAVSMPWELLRAQMH